MQTGLSWQAVGIPITPYDDDGTWDPYGTAVITVKNSSRTGPSDSQRRGACFDRDDVQQLSRHHKPAARHPAEA